MSSVDDHPVLVPQRVGATDASPAAPNAEFESVASATRHPPFDELIAALNQMMLLAQALRQPGHAGREEVGHDRS